MRASKCLVWTAMALSACATAMAEAILLPPKDIDVIGKIRMIEAKDSDTLLDIGREFSVGYEAMLRANPGLDSWYPSAGAQVFIPSRYILPDAAREGIVLNLPEMRLYYFPKDEQVVYVYPVGIGTEGRETPLGVQYITEKRVNPTWTPPASIRAEREAAGESLPAVVPAGEDNPLGTRAMRLTNPSYLIHGTNRPDGVGMRVSAGCVRMFPENVEELFDLVPKGTKVNIINQPLKIGWYGDSLYMEYHVPLEEYFMTRDEALYQAQEKIRVMAAERGLTVSPQIIESVIDEASGLPVEVGFLPL